MKHSIRLAITCVLAAFSLSIAQAAEQKAEVTFKGNPSSPAIASDRELPDPANLSNRTAQHDILALAATPHTPDQQFTLSMRDVASQIEVKVLSSLSSKIITLHNAHSVTPTSQWVITPSTTPDQLAAIKLQLLQAFKLDPRPKRGSAATASEPGPR